MYVAKENGRNGYAFFTPGMTDKAVRYLALNHDLHRGFKAREMVFLHYQALYHAETQALVGLEALLRWQHPYGAWFHQRHHSASLKKRHDRGNWGMGAGRVVSTTSRLAGPGLHSSPFPSTFPPPNLFTETSFIILKSC